jgi:hypothetical protein
MAIYSLFSRESFDIQLGYDERNKKNYFFPMGISSKNHFLPNHKGHKYQKPNSLPYWVKFILKSVLHKKF